MSALYTLLIGNVRVNRSVFCLKVSDGSLCAVTGMPDNELAVGCSDCSVCIWKLEWDSKKCIVG